jgi:hypothetical protein
MILFQIQQAEASSLSNELFKNFSWVFVSRLAIDILAVFVLIRLIYYKKYRRNDLFLSFFGFNFIIFFITFLLNKVNMSMGAAFGLFAVFSMLRYRTENLSAKDVTYLFICIALGLITAVSAGNLLELGLLCGILILTIALLEGKLLMKQEQTKTIFYDKVALITPERRAELIADLEQRTGLVIHRVEIQNIDFLKDSAELTAYYY